MEIISYTNDYYRIKYKDQIGYINEVFIWNDNLEKLKKDTIIKTNYNRLKEIYGEKNANKIINNFIWTGMTNSMIVEVLGNPINKLTEQFIVHEQWTLESKKQNEKFDEFIKYQTNNDKTKSISLYVYKNESGVDFTISKNEKYYYFENNKLTFILDKL